MPEISRCYHALAAAPPVRAANGNGEGSAPLLKPGSSPPFLKLKTKRYAQMKEQTLNELWKSLDWPDRTELLQTVSSELFVGTDAFNAWRLGYRQIPKTKRRHLTIIVKKKYGINLKTA